MKEACLRLLLRTSVLVSISERASPTTSIACSTQK